MSLFRLNGPQTRPLIPGPVHNSSVEENVFAKIKGLIDVSKIPPKLYMIRESLIEMPSPIHLRYVQLVQRALRVYASARIPVPVPISIDMRISMCLKNLSQ